VRFYDRKLLCLGQKISRRWRSVHGRNYFSLRDQMTNQIHTTRENRNYESSDHLKVFKEHEVNKHRKHSGDYHCRSCRAFNYGYLLQETDETKHGQSKPNGNCAKNHAKTKNEQRRKHCMFFHNLPF